MNKTATPQEVIEVLEHLKSHPEENFLEIMTEEWGKTPSTADPNKDYSRIYRAISLAIHRKNIRSETVFNIVKWAAAFSLILMSVYLIYNFNVPKASHQAIKVEMVEKINPIGQKSKIQLPDGSVAWLNADSKLIFPAKFDSIRTVDLMGEAYFEVAHHPEKPFLVISGNITTQALGTAFNIRAYQEEDLIQVALTKGKIKVNVVRESGNKEEVYVIDPGRSINYSKNQDSIENSLFIYNDVAGWKEGILVFNNSGEEDVFSKLTKWYGVKFEFKGNSSDQQWDYNGYFKNEYLENILNSIGSIKKFDYSIDNNKVEIIYH